jgi:hypothetical protein
VKADRFLLGAVLLLAVALVPFAVPLLAAGSGPADGGFAAASLDRFERGPLAGVPVLPAALPPAPDAADHAALVIRVATTAVPARRGADGSETCLLL